MTDFKSMLLDAMNQGVSLEDVMKGISDAASVIEKEKQESINRYDKYEKRAWESFGNLVSAENAILHADKIALGDMATVIVHFLCQQVPGYAKAMAKADIEPINTYIGMLESQISAAKLMVEIQDVPEEQKGKFMLNHLLDEVFSAISKDADAVKVEVPSSTIPNVSKSYPPISDAEKIRTFFNQIGL